MEQANFDSKFSGDDQVAVRMFGLSYRVEDSEVEEGLLQTGSSRSSPTPSSTARTNPDARMVSEPFSWRQMKRLPTQSRSSTRPTSVNATST